LTKEDLDSMSKYKELESVSVINGIHWLKVYSDLTHTNVTQPPISLTKELCDTAVTVAVTYIQLSCSPITSDVFTTGSQPQTGSGQHRALCFPDNCL